MSITVANLKEYLTDRTSGRSGNLTNAVQERAIIHALRMLAEHCEWSFYRKSTQLVTVADYRTGYVDLTHNSAAVAGSGTTFVAGHVGNVLVPDNQNRAYTVASYVSAEGLALDGVYVSDTEVDATGQSYKIYYRDVTLPTDMRSVEAVYLSGAGDPDYLHDVRVEEVEEAWALRAGGGVPRFYSLIHTVSSGTSTYKLRLYPAPEKVHALRLVYHRWPTEPDVTNDAATFDWPDKYRDALYAAAMLAVADDAFVELRSLARQEFRNAVDRVKIDDKRHAGTIVLGGSKLKARPNRFTIINTIARP